MDSQTVPDMCGESRQSRRSAGKESESPLRASRRDKHRGEAGSSAGDRAQTRTHVPHRDRDRERETDQETDRDRETDQDRETEQEKDRERKRETDREKEKDREKGRDREQYSNGERRSASFYSDDYESVSASEHLFSPRSPSPRRAVRAKRVCSSPLHRAGLSKGLSRRPGPQQQPPRTPPRDADLVTRRLLSGRLLKINELRNALTELRSRTDELQRENRLLRQLQLRQERALGRHGDAEGEIAGLLQRHGNETAALRESLRRSREAARSAENSLRQRDQQLLHLRSQLQRLSRLAEDQQLGEREELTRRLALEQTRAQDGERRAKELERSMELSAGSFQRQLAAERRRSHDAQEEVRSLQEEVERLSTKLKEKERELDYRNIYTNRMHKPRNEPGKRKGLSRSNCKAVQTEDRKLSLGFSSPPPAITNGNPLPPEHGADDYLSLKQELGDGEPRQKEVEGWTEREREQERVREREEKQRMELTALEEKAKRLRDETEREEVEDRKRRGLAQEEEEKRGGDLVASQVRAEEERRRKEQLLAKMREIDRQAQSTEMFSEPPADPIAAVTARSPLRLSEPRNQSASIFSFTEPGQSAGARGGEGGDRRAVRGQQRAWQGEELDLAFGSYTPSFGRPAARAGLPLRPPQSPSTEPDAELGGLEDRDRKSSLMEQLFGSGTQTTPDPGSTLEVLSPPSAKPPLDAPPALRDPTPPLAPPGPPWRAAGPEEPPRRQGRRLEEVTL